MAYFAIIFLLSWCVIASLNFTQKYFYHLLFYLSSVIVTEKTNILLRYLHQQWDKKVGGGELGLNSLV